MLDRRRVADVGRHGERPAAGRTDAPRHGFQGAFVARRQHAAAPASANARAVAAPIPRLAPATSATFPSNGADIVSSEEPAAVVTFLLCFIGTPSRALM